VLQPGQRRSLSIACCSLDCRHPRRPRLGTQSGTPSRLGHSGRPECQRAHHRAAVHKRKLTLRQNWVRTPVRGSCVKLLLGRRKSVAVSVLTLRSLVKHSLRETRWSTNGKSTLTLSAKQRRSVMTQVRSGGVGATGQGISRRQHPHTAQSPRNTLVAAGAPLNTNGKDTRAAGSCGEQARPGRRQNPLAEHVVEFLSERAAAWRQRTAASGGSCRTLPLKPECLKPGLWGASSLACGSQSGGGHSCPLHKLSTAKCPCTTRTAQQPQRQHKVVKIKRSTRVFSRHPEGMGDARQGASRKSGVEKKEKVI
jgi:hypothetical protein